MKKLLVKMFKNILVVSPHTDDGELGAGGSLAKFSREGSQITHLVFFDEEKQSEEILKEFEKSNSILAPSSDRIVERFEIRNYEKDRQRMLDLMIEIERSFKPDLVFLPSSRDFHQDHMTVSREGLRAFKFSTIFGYEEPWNNLAFETSCFIEISKGDLLKKLRALNCYESQKAHYYFSEEIIRSLALVRGMQIKAQYAEAFEIMRIIIR